MLARAIALFAAFLVIGLGDTDIEDPWMLHDQTAVPVWMLWVNRDSIHIPSTVLNASGLARHEHGTRPGLAAPSTHVCSAEGHALPPI
jgi:hypothetical protein